MLPAWIVFFSSTSGVVVDSVLSVVAPSIGALRRALLLLAATGFALAVAGIRNATIKTEEPKS